MCDVMEKAEASERALFFSRILLSEMKTDM